jgi:hypothetical protein
MHELKYADARERYSLNPDISSMYEKNNSRVKLRTHRSAAHLIRSIILPPFQNTRHRWLFSATLIIHFIQKIVRIQFILFAIYFNVVWILSLTYRFTCLR